MIALVENELKNNNTLKTHNMALRRLHCKKVKDKRGGWHVTRTKSNKPEEICWGKTKDLCLKNFRALLNDIQPGVSLRIHGLDGKFKDENTYPRSMDPRRSKG